jgi:hypothetical protein
MTYRDALEAIPFSSVSLGDMTVHIYKVEQLSISS